jgi:hypothetical protein
MCSAEPVPFLAKVALAAELIAVVKIDFSAFLVFQVVPLFWVMTVNAAQSGTVFPMFQDNITVGQLHGLIHRYRLTTVAAAALISANLFFPGENLERPALISFLRQNRILDNILIEGYGSVVKWLVNVLYLVQKGLLTCQTGNSAQPDDQAGPHH